MTFLYQLTEACRKVPSDHMLLQQQGQFLTQPVIKSRWGKWLTPEMRAENRKIWHAFNQCLKNCFSEERLARFSAYGVNLKANERSGQPFLVRYVEMAGVISADVRTSDLKVNREKLKFLSPSQIHDRICRLNPLKYIGLCPPLEKIYGNPTENQAFFVFDPFLTDKERLHLCQNFYLSNHPDAFLERIAKSLISRKMDEGKTILPAPAGNGKIDYYKVYKKIDTGHGLVAYAFKPISKQSLLPPLLVFRPTQVALSAECFVEAWINNAQLEYGEWGYQGSSKQLRDLMEDEKFCPPGRKITAAGFSLAGVHLQRFMVDHFQKVSYAVFFNDPSIENRTVEGFARKMNSMLRLKEQLKIKIYRTLGDIAPSMGEKHLFWGVEHPDVDIEICEINPFPEDGITGSYLHSHRFLDAPEKRYAENKYRGLDAKAQLDNYDRGKDVIYYELWRRSMIFRLAYGYICALYCVCTVVSKALGAALFYAGKKSGYAMKSG